MLMKVKGSKVKPEWSVLVVCDPENVDRLFEKWEVWSGERITFISWYSNMAASRFNRICVYDYGREEEPKIVKGKKERLFSLNNLLLHDGFIEMMNED
jgi:hypothetical protein